MLNSEPGLQYVAVVQFLAISFGGKLCSVCIDFELSHCQSLLVLSFAFGPHSCRSPYMLAIVKISSWWRFQRLVVHDNVEANGNRLQCDQVFTRWEEHGEFTLATVGRSYYLIDFFTSVAGSICKENHALPQSVTSRLCE